jgi:hypothetical protein
MVGVMENGGGEEDCGSCTDVEVDVDGRGVNGRRKAVGRWHDGEWRRR